MSTDDTSMNEVIEKIKEAGVQVPPQPDPVVFNEEMVANSAVYMFEKLTNEAMRLAITMTGRQLTRVLRAVLCAPLKPFPKFVHPSEKKLFDLAVNSIDQKMIYIGHVLKHQGMDALQPTEVTQTETKGEESNG